MRPETIPVTRVTGSGARPDDQPAPDGRPVIVTMPIAIDMTNTVQVQSRLSAAVGSGALVVIDLSATAFCDAAGVNHLHMIGSQAVAGGARLRLVIPPGTPLRQMLLLLDIDRLLPVYA